MFWTLTQALVVLKSSHVQHELSWPPKSCVMDVHGMLVVFIPTPSLASLTQVHLFSDPAAVVFHVFVLLNFRGVRTGGED